MVAVSKSKGRPKTLDDGELVTAGEVMADEALASGPKSRRRTRRRLSVHSEPWSGWVWLAVAS